LRPGGTGTGTIVGKPRCSEQWLSPAQVKRRGFARCFVPSCFMATVIRADANFFWLAQFDLSDGYFSPVPRQAITGAIAGRAMLGATERSGASEGVRDCQAFLPGCFLSVDRVARQGHWEFSRATVVRAADKNPFGSPNSIFQKAILAWSQGRQSLGQWLGRGG
jgi:hypothetical protein